MIIWINKIKEIYKPCKCNILRAVWQGSLQLYAHRNVLDSNHAWNKTFPHQRHKHGSELVLWGPEKSIATYTLPETSIFAENGWLEYDPFLLGPSAYFQGLRGYVSFREGSRVATKWPKSRSSKEGSAPSCTIRLQSKCFLNKCRVRSGISTHAPNAVQR